MPDLRKDSAPACVRPMAQSPTSQRARAVQSMRARRSKRTFGFLCRDDPLHPSPNHLPTNCAWIASTLAKTRPPTGAVHRASSARGPFGPTNRGSPTHASRTNQRRGRTSGALRARQTRRRRRRTETRPFRHGAGTGASRQGIREKPTRGATTLRQSIPTRIPDESTHSSFVEIPGLPYFIRSLLQSLHA